MEQTLPPEEMEALIILFELDASPEHQQDVQRNRTLENQGLARLHAAFSSIGINCVADFLSND